MQYLWVLSCFLAPSLCTNMYPGLRPTQVRLGSSFKWGEGNAPRWTGVFMASNDEMPILDIALDGARSFPRERRALVTVIGGMKYLEIMARVEFSEVHFFDMNINELTKMRLVHGDIVAKDYDAWVASGGMMSVTDAILRNADEFFLPRALHGAGVTLKPDASHEWPTHDADFVGLYSGSTARRAGSLYAMFAPHKWPEYQWKPTREQYERVRRQLSDPSCVADVFHMSLPTGLVAPHMFVTVYLNGVDYKYCQLHQVRAVSRAGLALGIYSTRLFRPGVRERAAEQGIKLVEDSTDWEDSHFFWDAAVRMHTLGRPECLDQGAPGLLPAGGDWRRVLHIWAPEDSAFVGGVYDWAFTWGISADELMASAAKRLAATKMEAEANNLSATVALALHATAIISALNCSTVVLHMLMGKASAPTVSVGQGGATTAVGTIEHCAARQQLFDNVLAAVLRAPSTVRCIVTEHNLDATTNSGIAESMLKRGTPHERVQFDRAKHPCVLGAGAVERAAAGVAAHVAAGGAGFKAARRFATTHSRVVAGNWAPDRNALVVLDAEGEVVVWEKGTADGSGDRDIDAPGLSVDVRVASGGGFGRRSNPNASAPELLAFPSDANADTRYALAAAECMQLGISDNNCVVAIDAAMTKEQRKYEGERAAVRKFQNVKVAAKEVR